MAKVTKTSDTEQQVKTSNGRQTALQTAFETIQKNFGTGAVMRLGDKPIQEYDVISSGCLSLDIALGVHGYPKGRIIEVYGPETSGKTTMCLHAAASVHKAGGTVAFVDMEHALDLNYAKKLGVDVNNLLLSQPEYAEMALEIVNQWVTSNAVDLVIVDSVAALVPKSEIEGEMGDAQMGIQARLMSQAMRKLTGVASKSNCALMFVNQLRQKIGVMFGNPETTTGGNALKFYASLRLDVRRVETIKVGDKSIGNRTRIKVVKNKVAPPFLETIVDIVYGKGIDVVADLIDTAVTYDVIQKSGSWYAYNNERLGQGRESTKEYFIDKPELLTELRTKILEKIK